MIRERDIFFMLLLILFLAGIAGAVLNNEKYRQRQMPKHSEQGTSKDSIVLKQYNN